MTQQSPPDDEATGDLLPPADAARLARSLTTLLSAAATQLGGEVPAPIRLIEDHLGCQLPEAYFVRTGAPRWQAATLTRAFDSYLADHGSTGDVVGLNDYAHEPLLNALQSVAEHRPRLVFTRPAYDSTPVSPTATQTTLTSGIARTSSPSGEPVVLAVRRVDDEGGQRLAIETLARSREACEETHASMRERVTRLDVSRGQVLTFAATEFYGDERTNFLPRPDISADEVILPEGTLERVRGHVLGIGDRAADLNDLGLHLKRGVLLHGPPGTGKTHLVRHLIGSTDATVVVLAGSALGYIGNAAALARTLTPAIVVCEDVDLIAMDRDLGPDGNAPLFMLLDAIDGVSGDADVCFILTTNRVADLEWALAQRPGRVDLAVEIPLPDAPARAALLRLYSGDLEVTADLGAAAERLEGQTASGMKEVMRRAGLQALTRGGSVVDDAVLTQVVDTFLDDSSAITRALLGGDPSDRDDMGPLEVPDQDDWT